MKIRNFLVAGVVLVAVVAQSCKKDEVKSVKNALLSGSWHLSAATISGDSIPTTNAIGTFVSSCDADNTYNFEENNSVIINEGAIKCNATDPQVDTSTWSVSTDETLLTIGLLPLTVSSHTNNSVVGYSDDFLPSTRITLTFSNN